MEKHTPREIIEQCKTRWITSEGEAWIGREQRHWIAAANSILDEFEKEGTADEN